MTKFKFFLTAIFTSIFLISCNPSDDSAISYSDTTFSKNFGSRVSRDFIGQIVDVNKNPIQNATVSIGSKSVQTDENGVFIINDANVYQQFAHIKATKAGFVDGSRSMVPTSGKNNVRIMLLSNDPVETIQSGEQSIVVLPNGTQVKFDGAFKDENGSAYSGTVQVSMFHLKPSDDNIASLMPGMLYAQDEEGKEKVLETYGMLNVELKGSAGQKLQIASGHTAEMSVLIDDSQLATAPATIPLWHFDEVNGYWKEEGIATRQGNKYVGNVRHFSWWNLDFLMTSVILTTRFVNSSNIPLANVYCYLFKASNDFMGSGLQMSDSNGEISGYVPDNELLNLIVFDNCGNIIYNNDIGPFSVDTVLPDIVINPANMQFTTINGTLLKCDNTNVTNGYVLIKGNDNNNFSYDNVQFVNNGVFTFSTFYCDPNFTVEGYDFDGQNGTGEINYNHVSPINNIGNIIACSGLNEYITYQIDGGSPVVLNANARVSYDASNGFWLFATNFDKYLDIHGSTNIPGSYTTLDGFSIVQDMLPYIFIDNNNTNNVVFQLNNFGAVGQYIDVTFNGTYTENNGVPITRTISGVAHIIRDN